MSDNTIFFKKEKRLYQFGDGFEDYYLFSPVDIMVIPSVSLKTLYQTNDGIDGQVKLNKNDRFKKTAISYKVDFRVNTNDYIDIDYIQQVFNQGGRKISFFYDLDSDGFVQFYFTYLTVTAPPIISYQAQQDRNQEEKILSIGLSADTPYLYKCTNPAYFDREVFAYSQPRFVSASGDDGETLYDDGISTYDQGVSVATIPVANLTKEERFDYFTGIKPRLPLVYTDRFFARENYSINTNNLLLDTTLSSASTTTTTNEALDESSGENNKYLIEIGQMAQNEEVSIKNQTNNTGIKFTWLSASPSPDPILYNSDSNRAYNSSGSVIATTDLRIERLLGGYLYFNPRRTLNKALTLTGDQLLIEKTTGGNLTLKIEALITYQ